MLEHGDKGQHIDGRFEEIQHVAATMPVEAVLRFAARCVAFESTLSCGASLVDMTDFLLLIDPHEHGIVVTIQPPVGEGIQHLLVDATAL